MHNLGQIHVEKSTYNFLTNPGASKQTRKQTNRTNQKHDLLGTGKYGLSRREEEHTGKWSQGEELAERDVTVWRQTRDIDWNPICEVTSLEPLSLSLSLFLSLSFSLSFSLSLFLFLSLEHGTPPLVTSSLDTFGSSLLLVLIVTSITAQGGRQGIIIVISVYSTNVTEA